MVRTFEDKIKRLSRYDRDLVSKYRQHEENIRINDRSLFQNSLEDHLEYVNKKSITERYERSMLRELINYHEWACTKADSDRDKSRRRKYIYVPFMEVVVSYENLYEFCRSRAASGMIVSSQTKISTAILRILLFIEAKMPIDQDMKKAIAEMRAKTRDLLSKTRKESRKLDKERLSVDELRERGKMISFTEVVKVCQKQNERVRMLMKKYEDAKCEHLRPAIAPILQRDVLRLSVLSTLLKHPVRTTELKAAKIDVTTSPWRLKISALSRKSGEPVNNRLSQKEMEIFQCLLDVNNFLDGTETEESTKMSWKPFEEIDVTKVLKTVTLDIAGVPMTIMDIRTVAESHVDVSSDPVVKRGLSFAQGHTERTAKEYYRRNGSTTLMDPWSSHVEGMIYGRNAIDNSDDDNDDEVGEKIEKRMEESQKRWKKMVLNEINEFEVEAEVPVINPKRTAQWSKEEDEELLRMIKQFGAFNWRVILKSSSLLRRRYKRTAASLDSHWVRVLLPRLISTGEYSVDSFRGEKKRRQKQKPRRSWQFRYNQLIAFKEENGHCRVPIRGTVLGRWVRDQRIQYKSFVRGEKFKGSLTEDKVDLLNAVGFSWSVTPMCLAKQRWMERYNELKAFKMENGHTDVPRNHPLGFGYWVYNQRRLRRRKKLSDDHKDLLDRIGFNWGEPQTPSWTERYNELKAFKIENGNMNVPRSHPLRYWVRNQRRLRRRNELSSDHKDLLDKIGFNWGKPQTACRDRHIKLYAAYKRVNGRLVPKGKDTVYYDVETAKPQPVSVYRYQLFKPRECLEHVLDAQPEKKTAEGELKSETHGKRKRNPTPAPTYSTITVPSKRRVVYSNVEYAQPIRQQVQDKQENINDGAIAIMSKRKGSVYTNVEYAQPIR